MRAWEGESRKMKKGGLTKSFWLMFLFVSGALLLFPVAVCLVDGEKEKVVITEEVISGDPQAAAGLTLLWKTAWQRQLLWETEYTVGSREEPASDFTFRPEKVSWEGIPEESVSVEIYGGWAAYDIVGEVNSYWPEITAAVAMRTNPGERHTETVRFADYYEYYPVHFSVTSGSGTYDYGEEGWTDFFRIPVQREHLLEITAEKDAEGNCVAIECLKMAGGVGVYESGAFGEQDCFFTFSCKTEEGEYFCPGAGSRIFYIPDITQVNNVVVKPVCELEEGVAPVELCRREDSLYLVAEEDGQICLKVYQLDGEIPVLLQSLQVCSGKEGVYWRGIFPTEGGLLLVWSDCSFAFIEEKDGRYEIFCKDIFPGADCAEDTAGYENVFTKENAICFDGERLALSAYSSWTDVDVKLAVFGRDGPEYYGIYHNSGELDRYAGAPGNLIQPQGYGRGGARAERPLEIAIER